MKKILMLSVCLVVYPKILAAQTVSIGASAVAAGGDFATKAFQDPWDLSQRTDLGWWIFGVDQPASGLTNVQFANGEFTATTTNAGPNVFLLDTGNPNAAKIGRIGTNYPIDAGTYKFIAFRMSVTTASFAQFIWNRDTIYDGTTTTAFNVSTTPGYRIYLVDLTTLSTVGAGKIAWSGLIRALRMNLSFAPAGESLKIDWVRLVNTSAGSCRTIQFSGATTVDLFLTDASGTSLGKIATNATANAASPGCTATPSGYTYYAGALAPGTYKVGVSAPGLSTPTSVSSGTWVVNDIPTLSFTSPDPEGSSDDFATTVLGNAWDMNSLTDLDLIQNVTSPQITSLPVETPAGTPLGTQQLFKGTSVSSAGTGLVGDPYVDPLFVTKRGLVNRIDTTRYRILTVEMGIPNAARDILNGSIARVVWRVAGQAAENVSDDIIFNHRAGANVLDKIVVDMADRNVLPLEAGSPSDWINGSSAQPGLDIFRFDPHEFSSPTDFYIKRIKLAALEKAAASYTIRWSLSDAQASSATVSLFYNTVNTATCSSGTLIASSVPASNAQFTWAVSGVADNTYYICAQFSDGTNTNETYARWPIVVQHSFTNPPRLSLNRTDLNFGIVQRPNETFPLVATAAQTVRVSVVGTGSPCWTVDPAVPAQSTYTVTLSGGGSQVCGSGSFTIAVNPASTSFNVTGIGGATFKVREITAGTTSNSPQFLHAAHQVLALTSAPVGVVDTPANGTQVSGSIAITGWVTDDVDIATITIYRDPVGGESGLIPIGNAVRVDDARPDIEAGNLLTPFNYRAGWGYLLLTNFLPSGGDGPFTLRVIATDVEGKQTLLGSPQIVGINGSTFRPFGAIDTPGQGEVISGINYNNFGWVLARGSVKASPFYPGASVSVLIDGIIVGVPTGWTSRNDLTTLFPETSYSGVSKALGVYTFNPGGYSNGVHTIAWLVTADNSQADGIGSRYFTVAASSSLTLDPSGVDAQRLDAGPDVGRRATSVGDIAPTGPRTVVASGLGRVVVDASAPGTKTYDAYMVANGRLRQLPVGASFDQSRGIIYWQPGVGYTGAYDFVVVRDGRERVPVRVVLEPQRGSRSALARLPVRFAIAP